MKKSISIALIVLLAVGSLFAGLSGKASIGYVYDLDSDDNGITNSKSSDYKFEFEFDKAVGSSKGEGSIYAEIAGEASATITQDGIDISTDIEKANIIAGDLTVNILGPKGAFDYASSFYKNASGKAAQYDNANAYTIEKNGFVATYKGFSLALSYNYGGAKDAVEPTYGWVDADEDPATAPVWGIVTEAKAAKDASRTFYTGLETKSFTITDELTAQAAFNFNSVDDKTQFGAGAKTSYKSDSFTASLAADFACANDKIGIDMAATAKYDFISASIYFGTTDAFKEDTNVLSAKVSASKKIESVTVSASVEVRDAIKAQTWIIADAKASYAAEKFDIYAGVSTSLKAINGEYKPVASAWGETEYAGLGVNAGVSSSAIIDNCKVAADWSDADFSGENAKLGKISTSATISF